MLAITLGKHDFLAKQCVKSIVVSLRMVNFHLIKTNGETEATTTPLKGGNPSKPQSVLIEQRSSNRDMTWTMQSWLVHDRILITAYYNPYSI